MQGFTRKISTAFGVAALFSLSALGSVAFASASGSDAHASNHDPYVKHSVVSYSDLDLNRVEDATRLYGRIERTARNVCRTSSGPSANASRIELECTYKAIANAVDDVSNGNLTAVHMTRVGKRSMVASSR